MKKRPFWDKIHRIKNKRSSDSFNIKINLKITFSSSKLDLQKNSLIFQINYFLKKC